MLDLVVVATIAVVIGYAVARIRAAASEHDLFMRGYGQGFADGKVFKSYVAEQEMDDVDAEAIEKFLRNPGGTL